MDKDEIQSIVEDSFSCRMPANQEFAMLDNSEVQDVVDVILDADS